MPFIGNQPALSYTSFAKQDFTTSATTSYTLDNPVANANELALFINFVRQEPTTAYSASGTSLTLTSATSATDDMYCVYLGKAVQTVNPPNCSVGLSQLTATGTKDSTTFLRGDNTFATAGGIFESQLLHVTHETADGTAGGATGSSSWTTRTINTIKTNEISGTLISNVISLGAGDYWLEGGAFFTNSGYIQTRFRDTTSGTNLIIGCNTYSEGYAGAWNTISGRFTLSGTKNLEVQYYCTTAYATSGQGMAAPASGEVNRFADFKIWKI